MLKTLSDLLVQKFFFNLLFLYVSHGSGHSSSLHSAVLAAATLKYDSNYLCI
jgi:hypothetical protein